jgi:hypothetical protein
MSTYIDKQFVDLKTNQLQNLEKLEKIEKHSVQIEENLEKLDKKLSKSDSHRRGNRKGVTNT